MNFRKLLLAGSAIAVGSAVFVTPTQASIIDRPHFKVEPIIIVWATDNTANGNPIVSDFVVGSASTDLIADDGRAVNTGSLQATEDAFTSGLDAVMNYAGAGGDFTPATASAGDLTAFDVTGVTLGEGSTNPTWDSSFYIASNTGFDIYAEASTLSTDFALSDIGISMSVSAGSAVTDGTVTWGANSQDPAGVFPAAITSLADLGSGAVTVFAGTVRTAAAAGAITSQSARFDTVFTLFPGGYDLSKGSGEIEAEVTYTFFAA